MLYEFKLKNLQLSGVTREHSIGIGFNIAIIGQILGIGICWKVVTVSVLAKMLGNVPLVSVTVSVSVPILDVFEYQYPPKSRYWYRYQYRYISREESKDYCPGPSPGFFKTLATPLLVLQIYL